MCVYIKACVKAKVVNLNKRNKTTKDINCYEPDAVTHLKFKIKVS